MLQNFIFNYNKDVWISINGKEGTYKKDKYEYNFRNYDEYDVWAFHKYPGQGKIDTIGFAKNNTKIIKGNSCKSCTDQIPKKKKEFVRLMKEWLVTPRDKGLRQSFED